MKYLKLFEKDTDYQSFITGGGGKVYPKFAIPMMKKKKIINHWLTKR